MTIGKYTVTIKNSLKWGDMEKIQEALGTTDVSKVDITKQMDANYTLLEVAITSVKEGDKEIGFSKEWMRDLDFNEGLDLVNAVSNLIKKNQTTGEQK